MVELSQSLTMNYTQTALLFKLDLVAERGVGARRLAGEVFGDDLALELVAMSAMSPA